MSYPERMDQESVKEKKRIIIYRLRILTDLPTMPEKCLRIEKMNLRDRYTSNQARLRLSAITILSRCLKEDAITIHSRIISAR
jgi:hypothetical protein